MRTATGKQKMRYFAFIGLGGVKDYPQAEAGNECPDYRRNLGSLPVEMAREQGSPNPQTSPNWQDSQDFLGFIHLVADLLASAARFLEEKYA